MSNEIIQQNNSEIIQKLVLEGDLTKMNPGQKVQYYNQFCQSLGLNPLTQPFQLIKFQGKERLYATKDCTEQLRKIHGVSIYESKSEMVSDLFMVTAYAEDKNGKKDTDLGVVNIKGLAGEALANAMMKAHTKAKRRVTLSICGLGMLDESELDTMPKHETKPIKQHDFTECQELEQSLHDPYHQYEIMNPIGDIERDELFELLNTSTYEQTMRDKLFNKINGLSTREEFDKAKANLLANQLGINGIANPSQKDISKHIKKITQTA